MYTFLNILQKHAGPRSNINDENRLLAFRPFRDASKKGVHIVIPDEDQSVPDHVVNNLGPMKHDLSSSFILVNTLDNSAKHHNEEDEEDEDYKTPLLQAVDGPLVAYQPQVSIISGSDDERLLSMLDFECRVERTAPGEGSSLSASSTTVLCWRHRFCQYWFTVRHHRGG